jgi:hypothetical protein
VKKLVMAIFVVAVLGMFLFFIGNCSSAENTETGGDGGTSGDGGTTANFDCNKMCAKQTECGTNDAGVSESSDGGSNGPDCMTMCNAFTAKDVMQSAFIEAANSCLNKTNCTEFNQCANSDIF